MNYSYAKVFSNQLAEIFAKTEHTFFTILFVQFKEAVSQNFQHCFCLILFQFDPRFRGQGAKTFFFVKGLKIFKWNEVTQVFRHVLYMLLKEYTEESIWETKIIFLYSIFWPILRLALVFFIANYYYWYWKYLILK